MCKISDIISEEETKKIEAIDILYEIILGRNAFDEMSLERLIEFEEKNYDSLDADCSIKHKNYSIPKE